MTKTQSQPPDFATMSFNQPVFVLGQLVPCTQPNSRRPVKPCYVAKNNVIHSNHRKKEKEAGARSPSRIELLFASSPSDHCLTSYSHHNTPSTPYPNIAVRGELPRRWDDSGGLLTGHKGGPRPHRTKKKNPWAARFLFLLLLLTPHHTHHHLTPPTGDTLA